MRPDPRRRRRPRPEPGPRGAGDGPPANLTVLAAKRGARWWWSSPWRLPMVAAPVSRVARRGTLVRNGRRDSADADDRGVAPPWRGLRRAPDASRAARPRPKPGD